MIGSALRRLSMGVFSSLLVVSMTTTALGNATPRIKPPAPGPSYMVPADHALLLELSSDLKAKRFPDAQAKITRLSDPVATSLGEWMYFMANDPKVNLGWAKNFLDSHNDWPATSRIQDHVEGRISRYASADEVLAFFENRDPVSGDGKIELAKALYSKGENDAGDIHLRDAWINHNFTIAKENAIISKYGKRLTKDDHAARVDRLLWARQVTNARRVISKLDKQERAKAKTRIAFILGASSAASQYNRLSKDDQLDSGVLLAAVRYYRRSGNQTRAISLASQSPKTPEALRNSSRWWYERRLLMRWALKEGRFAEAYTAAANHGLEPGGDFADAEFGAGWIALRFLNDADRAETHFLALASEVATPISMSRAYYWLGRTATVKGKGILATAYYKLAARHYYSYYGQLAAEELGGLAVQKRFEPPVTPSPADKARFASRPTVAALRMLSDLDLDYEFMVFSYHIDGRLDRPGEFVELASLTKGEGAPHLSVRAGKVAIQRNAFTPDVAYPVVFVPEEAKRFVSPEIVLGLSRQESEFNPRAYSSVGARGMMQLMPATAQITAKKEGLRYSRSALLDDPVYNMTIGAAHLSHLIDRFDGSLILTFAAYNAGASRADNWIKTYGDPRREGVDPVDWVELIPFSETRNYVQRVLENVQVYRGRLNNAPIPGRLSADLGRGRSPNRVALRATEPSAILAAATKKVAAADLPPVPGATQARAAQFRRTSAIAELPTAPTLVQPPMFGHDDHMPLAPSLDPNSIKSVATPIEHQPINTDTMDETIVADTAARKIDGQLLDQSVAPAADPIVSDIAVNVATEQIAVTAPVAQIPRPSSPALQMMAPAEAPPPLEEKAVPTVVEDFISRVYAPRLAPTNDTLTDASNSENSIEQ